MRSLALLARTPLRTPFSLSRSTPLSTTLPLRMLSTTPRRLLKEDGDRTPEQIESKKQEQLDKQKRGEGHWHEELASSGESGVKADREEVEDHGEHMKELQKDTAQKGESGKI